MINLGNKCIGGENRKRFFAKQVVGSSRRPAKGILKLVKSIAELGLGAVFTTDHKIYQKY